MLFPGLPSRTTLSSSSAIHSTDDPLRFFDRRKPPSFVAHLFFFLICNEIRPSWHLSTPATRLIQNTLSKGMAWFLCEADGAERVTVTLWLIIIILATTEAT